MKNVYRCDECCLFTKPEELFRVYLGYGNWESCCIFCKCHLKVEDSLAARREARKKGERPCRIDETGEGGSVSRSILDLRSAKPLK